MRFFVEDRVPYTKMINSDPRKICQTGEIGTPFRFCGENISVTYCRDQLARQKRSAFRERRLDDYGSNSLARKLLLGSGHIGVAGYKFSVASRRAYIRPEKSHVVVVVVVVDFDALND